MDSSVKREFTITKQELLDLGFMDSDPEFYNPNIKFIRLNSGVEIGVDMSRNSVFIFNDPVLPVSIPNCRTIEDVKDVIRLWS